MRKFTVVLFVLCMSLSVFSGCGTSKRTVTTEQRVEITDSDPSRDTTEHSDQERTTVTTTVEEKETPAPDCAGILSCTVEFVGDVISLPFRLVAGLIRFIF